MNKLLTMFFRYWAGILLVAASWYAVAVQQQLLVSLPLFLLAIMSVARTAQQYAGSRLFDREVLPRGHVYRVAGQEPVDARMPTGSHMVAVEILTRKAVPTGEYRFFIAGGELKYEYFSFSRWFGYFRTITAEEVENIRAGDPPKRLADDLRDIL